MGLGLVFSLNAQMWAFKFPLVRSPCLAIEDRSGIPLDHSVIERAAELPDGVAEDSLLFARLEVQVISCARRAGASSSLPGGGHGRPASELGFFMSLVPEGRIAILPESDAEGKSSHRAIENVTV